MSIYSYTRTDNNIMVMALPAGLVALHKRYCRMWTEDSPFPDRKIDFRVLIPKRIIAFSLAIPSARISELQYFVCLFVPLQDGSSSVSIDGANPIPILKGVFMHLVSVLSLFLREDNPLGLLFSSSMQIATRHRSPLSLPPFQVESRIFFWIALLLEWLTAIQTLFPQVLIFVHYWQNN